MKLLIDNKKSLIPLGISALFFYFNFAIGDTILGNVIVLFISLVAGTLSFTLAYSDFRNAEESTVPRTIMIISGVIIASIVLLVLTDNISMGYGP